MLILSRKIGERVKVTTPCNRVIWIEQADGHVLINSDGFPVRTTKAGVQIISVGYDRIAVFHTDKSVQSVTRKPLDRKGIGIAAPYEYAIIREELIGTEGRR